MRAVIDTAPAIEPVTMEEVTEHLRLDSGNLGDILTEAVSLALEYRASGSTAGTGIAIGGKRAVVKLYSKQISLHATADVAIQTMVQYSDDDITYADWQALETIGDGDDDVFFNLEYTGSKEYIRAVMVVSAGDGCECGVNVQMYAPTFADESELTRLIAMAREDVESYTRRALISQTWTMYLDDWPSGRSIELPLGNLQSVTHVKYTDTAGDQSTWSSDDYVVDTYGITGRIIPGYGLSYPSVTLGVSSAIEIKFVCGYGDAASDVPGGLRQAVLDTIADHYENRETISLQPYTYKENSLARRLMDKHVIHTFSRMGKDGFAEGMT